MKPSTLSAHLSLLAAVLLAGCETTGDPVDTRDVNRVDSSSQGTLVATTRAAAGSGRREALETAGDPEGIVRLRGRLYYLKDRGTSVLRGRQRVTNSLHLESNGDVILADGRRVRLVEGYMVTTGGEVIEAPRYLR